MRMRSQARKRVGHSQSHPASRRKTPREGKGRVQAAQSIITIHVHEKLTLALATDNHVLQRCAHMGQSIAQDSALSFFDCVASLGCRYRLHCYFPKSWSDRYVSESDVHM